MEDYTISFSSNAILLHDSFIVSQVKDWKRKRTGSCLQAISPIIFERAFANSGVDVYQSIGNFDQWNHETAREFVTCIKRHFPNY